MENIKLIEFLLNYNFRKPTKEGNGFNTSIIRIYLSDNLDDWIEYGLYDFDSNESKKNRIICSLNKKLINKRIHYYYFDDDDEVFSIFLKEVER